MLGPYSAEELAGLAKKGAVLKSSMLQSVEDGSWIRADQMPIIFETRPRFTPIPGSELAGHTAVTSSSTKEVPIVPPVAIKQSPMDQRMTGRSSRSNTAIIALVTLLACAVMVIFGLVIFRLPRSTPPQNSTAQNSTAQNSIAKESIAKESIAKESTNSNSSSDNEHESPLSNATPTTGGNLSTKEIVQRTQKSVALIAADGSSGSGFVVAPNIVATNYHVIADCDASSMQVYFPDGEKGAKNAVVIAEMPKRDLALLKIQDSTTPPLIIDRSHGFIKGQDVVIIGSPGIFRGMDVLPNAVSKGILSSQTEVDGIALFQLSAAVNPGNSGGPVFGPDGNVIGVVVLKSLTEEAISFCIPADDLLQLMDECAMAGYANSEKVVFEHNARKVIHSVTLQTLELERVINGISVILEGKGENISQKSASDFTKEITSIFEKENPDLVRNFALEFDDILKSPQITKKQRSDIEVLRQRHDAINRLLRNPPGNLVRLNTDMERLREQYLNQLKVVSTSLELQKY
jgi:S1-C subfamily serine protease